MRQLGILGGTFDPPHIGHLLLAETARETLQLEQVLFLPAGQPPHKGDRTISPAEHRLAMTELLVAENPHYRADPLDLHRPPPHYTATLLPLLRDGYPDAVLWLLIGGDSLRDFLSWHRPEEILKFARLAVLPRPGADPDWPALVAALPALEGAVTFLDGPSVALSATQIRRWAAAGRGLNYLMPPAVREYIHRHQLYR